MLSLIFYLRPSKRLNKQSGRRWFETPSRSLWRHCNVYLNDEFRELVWHPHGHPSLVRPPTDIELHSEDFPSSTATRSCRHLLHVGQGLTDLLSPFLGCYLWKKNMMTSSNGNIFRFTGNMCWEFTGDPAQRPVTRSFNVFLDLRLNKPLSKQSWGWWFEMLSRPLWRHCNDKKNVKTSWHGKGYTD